MLDSFDTTLKQKNCVSSWMLLVTPVNPDNHNSKCKFSLRDPETYDIYLNKLYMQNKSIAL